MIYRPSRRQILTAASVAGIGYWVTGGSSARAESKSPNEKLHVAVIGAGGMGAGHVEDSAAQERLVALCDVDDTRAAESFDKNPNARKFRDFRKMFDAMGKEIDAVFVATPDHIHAPASMMAMRLGKGVYCQKPLAHEVHELRVMAKTAKEMKVATQMGNQGHSSPGTRALVEVIRDGAIGTIREAHCWCPKNFSATARPQGTPPVPDTLDWDLWLGPAPQRPYHPDYLPFNWRSRWDFGTGGLGDMACHIIDPAFWALDLGYPSSVEADGDPKQNLEGFASNLTVKYEFPKRGDASYQAPCTVYWHHGNHIPQQRPIKGVELPADLKLPDECILFIGDKGMILGVHTKGVIAMLPKEKFADYKAPAKSLRQSPGHEEEFFAACKTGSSTGSNFQYAAMLSEMVLLGNVAHRVGKRLEWDGENMKAKNSPEANALLQREYRKGWEL